MKLAQIYVARPMPVRAIQLAPTNEQSPEYRASFRELLADMKWESGKNGSVAVMLPVTTHGGPLAYIPMVAKPGDWIIREDGACAVCSDETFVRTYMPAEEHEGFRKLEAERFHVGI